MKVNRIVILVSVAVLVVVAILALVVWGLWSFAGTLEREGLATWAILATLALPFVFLAGFWFGKTEVRGFLAGVDKSLDKLAAAVDLRDTSRISMHNAVKAKPQPPSFNVIMPGGGHPFLPPISHRSSSSDEVIDL